MHITYMLIRKKKQTRIVNKGREMESITNNQVSSLIVLKKVLLFTLSPTNYLEKNHKIENLLFCYKR